MRTTSVSLVITSAMIAATLSLAGCGKAPPPPPPGDGPHAAIDQQTLCQVDTWKPINVADACTPGQKILFRPGTNAGATDAALFAAANCDLRYTVTATPGGTACIYRPIRSANAIAAPDTAG